MPADRGRETSWELCEIRTVLSRAETAIVQIQDPRLHAPPDPERAEMLDALDHMVDELKRWRRTGRPLKN